MSNRHRFENFVFAAALNTYEGIPNCSLVHFEVDDAQGSIHRESDEPVEKTGKVLWCIDVQTGEAIDWCEEKYSFTRLSHCKSVTTGLCNAGCEYGEFEVLGSRQQRSQSESQCMNPYDNRGTNLNELIAWRALEEAEEFAKCPRVYETAIQETDQARIIAARSSDDNQLIVCHANEAWEKLCGYSREELIGEKLPDLRGRDTDPKITKILGDAIEKALDISALVINYKKNGESFMNRLRIVPLRKDASQRPHYLGMLRQTRKSKAMSGKGM